MRAVQYANDLDICTDAVHHYEGRPRDDELACERHASRPPHGRIFSEALNGRAEAYQCAERRGRIVTRYVIRLCIEGTKRCPEPPNAHDAWTAAW